MRKPLVLSKPLSLKFAISLLLFIATLLGGAGIYFYLYPKWKGSSTEAPTIKLSCPVSEEFCASAREVLTFGGTGGNIGFTLPKGTAISTPIAGYLTMSSLVSPEKAHVAKIVPAPGETDTPSVKLIFKGELASFGQGSVVKGFQIGSSGEAFAAYIRDEEVNLIIQIYEEGTLVSDPLDYLEVTQ